MTYPSHLLLNFQLFLSPLCIFLAFPSAVHPSSFLCFCPLRLTLLHLSFIFIFKVFCLSLSSAPHLIYLAFLAVPLSPFSLSHILSLPLHERFIEQTGEAYLGCYWWKRLQDISSVMSEWFFLPADDWEQCKTWCSIFSFSMHPCTHFPSQDLSSVFPSMHFSPFPPLFLNPTNNFCLMSIYGNLTKGVKSPLHQRSWSDEIRLTTLSAEMAL